VFIKDLVIYRLYNFDQKPIVVFSATMLNKTSSAKHMRMSVLSHRSHPSLHMLWSQVALIFPKTPSPCLVAEEIVHFNLPDLEILLAIELFDFELGTLSFCHSLFFSAFVVSISKSSTKL
jgi:hypothetical protein